MDSSSFMSPSQTAPVAAYLPSPAPSSSTAMEVVPQGAQPSNCNWMSVLGDALQHALVNYIQNSPATKEAYAEFINRPPTQEVIAEVVSPPPTQEDVAEVVSLPPTQEDIAEVVSFSPTQEDIAEVVSSPLTQEDITEVVSSPPTQENIAEVVSSPPTQQESQLPLPKFRLSNNSTSYAAVTAMAVKPGIKLSARPNRKGDLIITPKDLETAKHLQEVPDLTLLDPALNRRKAIISRYPTTMPISIVTSCSNIETADRCTTRENVPVRRLLATFIGPVPSSLDLGVWGTFPIQEYTPEPLRCYHCQRYGHHKEDCKSPAFCGVCSQRHNTEICIQAHKNGQETRPKCRNCSKPHHAWNKRCPERLRRIAAMKGSSSPKNNKPVSPQKPKGQRPPRQRRQRQPTTAPASASAKQNQAPTVPVSSPAISLQAASTSQPATSPPQPTSLTQQIESLTLSELVPIAIHILTKILSLTSNPSQSPAILTNLQSRSREGI
ncbi:uncharacterized protein [Palaemon carinicauda]|uniref:uncharacterized protein n=1 Tax=Palaemon carinicauda TaxID=392227 RepID=UPI0035B64391